MTQRNALFAVTGVLLLAALVRIINIDGPALWTDEGFTYYTFTVDLFEALVNDRHPPFYFYTLHGWATLAGDSILALRWWSFLPSMLTIAVAYQLGRELLRHNPGLLARGGALGLPVLAALMMALADGENYLAQELRMYTWHVLFAAASLLFYLRYTRQPSRWRAALWVAANVLLIHTHYFGAYVLAAQGLHALLFLRGRGRLGAVAALGVSGVLFLPWFLGVTLEQFASDEVCINCPAPDNWQRLLEFRLLWFGQQWPLTLLLFGFGFVSVRRRLVFLLALLIVLPLAVTYVLGHEEDIFFAHRLSQITVPITLLLALGIANFPTTARLVVAGALILYGVTTIDWYRVKVPWDEVTALIAPYVEPDEVVFGEVGPEESALRYYLDHMLPEGVDVRSFPMWGIMDRHDYYTRQVPQLLAEQRVTQPSEVKSAWVIYFTLDTTVLDFLEAEGYTRTFRDVHTHVDDSEIEVFRYDILPDEPLGTFEAGLTLQAAEINDLRVDLWWTIDADNPPQEELVVSAFLLDESGQLVVQNDSLPGERSALGWSPGEIVYDPRPLDPPPPGEYTVAVQVYSFAPDGSLRNYPLTDGEPYLVLGTLTR